MFSAPLFPFDVEQEDKSSWQRKGNGKFSIKSCYNKIIIDKGLVDPNDNDWLWLWKLKLPYKIVHFLWTLRVDKILSGEK